MLQTATEWTNELYSPVPTHQTRDILSILTNSMFDIFQNLQDITEEDIRKVEMCRGDVLQASWGHFYFYSEFSTTAP